MAGARSRHRLAPGDRHRAQRLRTHSASHGRRSVRGAIPEPQPRACGASASAHAILASLPCTCGASRSAHPQMHIVWHGTEAWHGCRASVGARPRAREAPRGAQRLLCRTLRTVDARGTLRAPLTLRLTLDPKPNPLDPSPSPILTLNPITLVLIKALFGLLSDAVDLRRCCGAPLLLQCMAPLTLAPL